MPTNVFGFEASIVYECSLSHKTSSTAGIFYQKLSNWATYLISKWCFILPWTLDPYIWSSKI